MSELALACEGLTKHYRRPFATPLLAVEGLDLAVPMGVTFGLLGPNGAGKTTTISMLLGLVRPTAGRATVLGGHAATEAAVRRRIGFVPEKFAVPPFLTALEFLALHGRLAGLSGLELQQRCGRVLDRVGLVGRGGDRAAGFSKGMQQRLMLGQAILHEPALLILDEPTSALDPVGRREVREIIEETRARGATVVLNSHLLAEVEMVSDQVAIMAKGRLLRQGTLNDLAGDGLRAEARVGAWSSAVAAALAPLVEALEAPAEAVGEPIPIRFGVRAEADMPRVAAAIVGAGGDLYALVPSTERLEDTFMRLVAADAPSVAPAAPDHPWPSEGP